MQSHKKKRIIAASLFLLVLFIGLAGYIYWVRSPAYSLGQTMQALKSHDVLAFEKYVDVERVSESLVDQFFMSVITKDPEIGSNTVALGLVYAMKPRLSSEVEKQLINYVEEGTFDVSGLQKEGGLVKLGIVKPSQAKVQFEKIAYTKKAGKRANLGAQFKLSRYPDRHFILDVQMANRGNYWQVTDIGATDLYGAIDNAENARVAKLNIPIQKKMARSLSVGQVQVIQESDEWGIDQYITYQVPVTNIGDQTITSCNLLVTVNTREGEPMETLMLSVDMPLPPHAQGVAFFGPQAVNAYDAQDVELYWAEQSQLKVEIEEILFANGTRLRLVKPFEKTNEA